MEHDQKIFLEFSDDFNCLDSVSNSINPLSIIEHRFGMCLLSNIATYDHEWK